MGMAVCESTRRNNIEPGLWKFCVLIAKKYDSNKTVKHWGVCCLRKHQKACTWIRPCHLGLVSRSALWQQEADSKATARFPCHSSSPDRIALKLLKASKQKSQQLHQRCTDGEVSNTEVKGHNSCACLLDKSPDQNPVCWLFKRWWTLGSEGPFAFSACVGLHVLVLEGIGEWEKSMRKWPNDCSQLCVKSAPSKVHWDFVC